MKYINYFNDFLANLLNVKHNYVSLIIYTIIAILIIKLINKLFILIYFKIFKENKGRFKFNKNITLFFNLILFAIILFIWEDFIKTFITLISFISAAIAYSLRDSIINIFAGIYIKIQKPFVIEDRISIDNYIGDVVNIKNQSFEILEVNSDEHNFQSTGSIIHIPNSRIFETELKNYTKVFKYKWNEININVSLDSDISFIKNEIYKILKNNETLKKIPNKMFKQLNNNGEYRIYYNKLDPIIYTKINDNYVTLSIRYLVHPKKTRNIESEIYDEILKLNKEGKLALFEKC